MKIDVRVFATLIFAFLLSILMLFSVFSCSPQYHLRKYQNKGGICGKIDTIRVTKFDTITNKYYFQDSIVIVNDRIVPLTRTELRYNERLRRDTIRYKETVLKYIYKTKKNEKKTELKMERSKNSPYKLAFIFIVLLALAFRLIKSDKYL